MQKLKTAKMNSPTPSEVKKDVEKSNLTSVPTNGTKSERKESLIERMKMKAATHRSLVKANIDISSNVKHSTIERPEVEISRQFVVFSPQKVEKVLEHSNSSISVTESDDKKSLNPDHEHSDSELLDPSINPRRRPSLTQTGPSEEEKALLHKLTPKERMKMRRLSYSRQPLASENIGRGEDDEVKEEKDNEEGKEEKCKEMTENIEDNYKKLLDVAMTNKSNIGSPTDNLEKQEENDDYINRINPCSHTPKTFSTENDATHRRTVSDGKTGFSKRSTSMHKRTFSFIMGVSFRTRVLHIPRK